MSRIAWNAVGQRRFEVGVDRGVLYLDGLDGVPWNGLVSISEAPTGAEVTPYYVDGIKHTNQVSLEEFEATLEAYTYPSEFDRCDGTRPVSNGLFATQQPRVPFGLSYRSKVGNDVDGVNHGYKIHVVYNAVAAPTERVHKTLGEDIDLDNFSWQIYTKPAPMVGQKPTAHFIIDSLETPSDLLAEIEDILYGSDDAMPRLPSANELMYLFNEYESSGFDGGLLVDDEYFAIFDGGHPGDPYDSLLDGGGA